MYNILENQFSSELLYNRIRSQDVIVLNVQRFCGATYRYLVFGSFPPCRITHILLLLLNHYNISVRVYFYYIRLLDVAAVLPLTFLV